MREMTHVCMGVGDANSCLRLTQLFEYDLANFLAGKCLEPRFELPAIGSDGGSGVDVIAKASPADDEFQGTTLDERSSHVETIQESPHAWVESYWLANGLRCPPLVKKVSQYKVPFIIPGRPSCHFRADRRPCDLPPYGPWTRADFEANAPRRFMKCRDLKRPRFVDADVAKEEEVFFSNRGVRKESASMKSSRSWLSLTPLSPIILSSQHQHLQLPHAFPERDSHRL